MKKNKVGFILRKINTEQFATIESNVGEGDDIQLRIGIDFGINPEHKIIACKSRFEFLANEKHFILIHVTCEFNIEPDSWNKFINETLNKISFPKGFMCHLAVITVGTTRGVLHAKTENTRFNQYLLPTIDVTNFVAQDITFELKK